MDKFEQLARGNFPYVGDCQCGGAHKICLDCAVCRVDAPDQIQDGSGNIATLIDATVLKADAKLEDVEKLCATALEHQCASVCINTFYIPYVNEILDGIVRTCTVINFPLGAGDAEAVLAEANAAIELGLDELDMVMNLAAVLSSNPEENYETIRLVADACRQNNVLLKVILETCFLSEEQIILASYHAKKAGADFVKTSTGFGSAGATEENIRIMRKAVGNKVGVKASGGIRTREQALAMIASGANRIGASSVIALID